MAKQTVRTLGIAVENIDSFDAYTRQCWHSAIDLAQRDGSNLIVFFGHSPDSDETQDSAYTALYRLIGRDLVGGLILPQIVLSWMTPARLQQFGGELPPQNVVSTSLKIGSHPAVFVDNAPGFRALIRHLIDDHGFHRIVHVRGPHPNQEAQVREDIWREELERSGITPEGSWLVQGHWDLEFLGDVSQRILEQTGGEFDAVVACNDVAALKITEDFQRLGYRVPEQFAITGFDDIVSADWAETGLTTVRLPVTRQMDIAWRLLTQASETTQTPDDDSVETSLVVRRSCSCPQEKIASSRRTHPSHTATQFTRRRESYSLGSFIRMMNRISHVDEIENVLVEWFPRFGIDRFMILRTCDQRGNLLEHTSQWIVGNVLPTAPEFLRIDSSVPEVPSHEPRIVPTETWAIPDWFLPKHPVSLGVFPLVKGDVWFGILTIPLSKESGFVEQALQEQLTTAFHRFMFERIHLEKVLAERTMIAVHQEQMAAMNRVMCEVAHEINTPLGAIVSSQSTLQIELENWITRDIPQLVTVGQDHMERVLSLYKLSRSRQASLDTKSTRCARKEHLALLESLNLADQVALADDFADLGLRASDPEVLELLELPNAGELVRQVSGLTGLMTSANIIGLAADKVGRFIRALRQASESSRFVNGAVGVNSVSATIESALALLADDLNRGTTIQTHFGERTDALCNADDIQQVWINLIRNALQAMSFQGHLEILCRSVPPWVLVEVSDNGPGVSPEHLEKIFTPFFTTKPEGQGMGLGLDICRRIVEACGGSIRCESQVGRTTFTVQLRAIVKEGRAEEPPLQR